MATEFNPCETCPLKGIDDKIKLTIIGEMMGEEYTDEDYDRIWGDLSGRDETFAAKMFEGYGIAPQTVNGEECAGPKKPFLIGRLACTGRGL